VEGDPLADDITHLLAQAGEGSSEAWDRLLPLVYNELRALARKSFRGRAGEDSLQPTILVHEAYLRLVAHTGKTPARKNWDSRAHFFAVAAMAMRQIVASHARRRRTAKRGGDRQRVTLNGLADEATGADVDIEALDAALERLSALDPRQGRLVELRFFGNLTVEEIAHVLDVSASTVEREWRMARAWLSGELRKAASP
jgi:RNA polymerase sigma factor (TIGR02999 family)